MKFDYIRMYEESKVEEKINSKFRIAFIRDSHISERVEDKDGNSLFHSKNDNVKKYYPQTYKDFLRMLKATKVVDGKIKVYDVYLGAPLVHDYKTRNFVYYQDKASINALINLAKDYYCNKDLSPEKQVAQKNEFFKRCCYILGEKVGIITAEPRR